MNELSLWQLRQYHNYLVDQLELSDEAIEHLDFLYLTYVKTQDYLQRQALKMAVPEGHA